MHASVFYWRDYMIRAKTLRLLKGIEGFHHGNQRLLEGAAAGPRSNPNTGLLLRNKPTNHRLGLGIAPFAEMLIAKLA